MHWMVWGLLLASAGAAAGEAGSLRPGLEQALLCGRQPEQVIDWLSARVGEDGSEGRVSASGEELDYRIEVALKAPIRIAGARTHKVVWHVEGQPDFGGIIFAEFTGDARTAVAALRLRRAQGEETHMGRFLREMADGSLCPRTILLTPVSGSRFLLGCGWCNGG